ncbi:MAG: hypothetical protein SWY16_10640 [Cyanobacteriota bacterium]|nr:hypothetical protein [Cyanobacteriota bacterium]
MAALRPLRSICYFPVHPARYRSPHSHHRPITAIARGYGKI